jgi:L-seryl-tRNA selenium transferase
VYLAGRAWQEMPTLRMLNTSEHELSERANAIGKAISATGLKVGISPDTTECGGAVLPGVLLPTWTVQVEHEKVKEEIQNDPALGSSGNDSSRQECIVEFAKCPSRGGIRNAQRDSRFSPVSCLRE